MNQQQKLRLQTGRAPNGARLDARLLHVAAVVWRKTRPLARLAYKTYGEAVNERECKHFARVAAFLAYAEAGGWGAGREALIKQAHHHMLQMLRRTDRTFDADRTLRKARTETVAVDQYRWNAWEQPLRNRNRGRLHNGYLPVADVPDNSTLVHTRQEYLPTQHEQEQALVEQSLRKLGSVLAQLLSKRDFALLDQHYFQSVPQRVLARQLGMSENAVNVGLHRARMRAQKALEQHGAHWREIATSA
jgi:RNA polymerase sigma factor (sigma-70 family)